MFVFSLDFVLVPRPEIYNQLIFIELLLDVSSDIYSNSFKLHGNSKTLGARSMHIFGEEEPPLCFQYSDSTSSAVHTPPQRRKMVNKKQSEKGEIHYKLMFHI